MKIISWNMAHRSASWDYLNSSGCDIALLQEAAAPPHSKEQWATPGKGKRNWKAAVVNVSREFELEVIKAKPLLEADYGDFGVSYPNTIAAAILQVPDQKPITVISLYALWQSLHDSAQSNWIMADASVHRLISDLSAFVGMQKEHRIIAAGDLNILYGQGENNSNYWKARYQTIFDRMDAIGLPFVGPQFPNGRQAKPWPKELPKDSLNVPTFHTNRQSPETATRQLDFVFASKSLQDQIKVIALNDHQHWGPSDHCQIEITIN